ncbi:hypothetical protein [Roseinatronobacter monicus]|uniref:Uncharacterized protein n=1 Tax=Roseinatronobacter monicus TaxID=393481 RepID=A0A543K4D4_9RHOB|nr:hypothetical protein [Roseinatronobacter monicus]TQM89947.1 hypothetical protein BD293_4265 [Roseinatronobacter monicus]
MTQTDGWGRNNVAWQKDIVGTSIKPHVIETRAHYARAEALKSFFAAKSATDFYFEEVLNSFIALAQYPLNFAVFRQNPNGSLSLVVHFCSDKRHEAAFVETLENLKPCTEPGPNQNVFRLFPHVLDNPAYHVAVFHMETKSSSFRLVPASMSVFPVWTRDDAAFRADPPLIDTPERYIASCADYFFQFKWDVFGQEFVHGAGSYLKTSLERLQNEQKTWAQRNAELERVLEAIGGRAGRGEADTWKTELERTFGSVLLNSTAGIDLASKMMRTADCQKPKSLQTLPNMFVAFRVFCRKPGDYRHDIDGSGYLYDTSILVPHQIRHTFSTVLNTLKAAGCEAGDSRASDFAKAFEGPNRSRRLFRNIVDTGGESFANPKVLAVIDQEFWRIIKAKGGLGKCINILASWVGSEARSLVDPVYHTGLIHTNPLFQGGGLDRLGDLDDLDIQNWEDIPEPLRHDALRVAIFYYMLSETVGWGDKGKPFDPERLVAILVPIKMRGAVWGVSIHGAYAPPRDLTFTDERYWQAYFKFATDHRHKNYQLFDRYLWVLAQEKVSDLFKEHYLTKEGRIDPHTAINKINRGLLGIETFSPFGFPTFSVTTAKRPDDNSVEVNPEQKNSQAWISWAIQDNRLFMAHQPWDGKSSRSFQDVVKHGALRSLHGYALREKELKRR